MSIGKQIRKYRQGLGLTLEQLCQLSGVEPGTISALENRDSSRSSHFPAICKAMGLTIEQMADETRTYPARPVGPETEGVITLGTAEPGVPYGWPFKDIKPAQWLSLGYEEREQIEKMIGMLVKAGPTAKHREPAYKRAAAR